MFTISLATALYFLLPDRPCAKNGPGIGCQRTYTYTWSPRSQLLAEYTNQVPVRTFAYDCAGQLVAATVFTLTTAFGYNCLGARVTLSVSGVITYYTLDTAAGNRVLVESAPASSVV